MKITGNKRLQNFAQQSLKQNKYMKCSLMRKKHIDELDIPKGFTIIYIDDRPYIGSIKNQKEQK